MDSRLVGSKLFYQALKFVAYAAGVLLLLGAGARGLYDVVSWLKTAHASGYRNADMLYDIGVVNQQTGWLGLQKILDSLLNWPAWSGLLFAAIIFFFIGGTAVAKLEDIKRFEDAQAWKKRERPF